ncbi:MAG: hypothetical protein COV55_00070 [Candidatus Komeilibacteria bacterium CG11_big_fil_rev_8_21_14_0_20_36_20]|uniref:Septum formation initiator n=1 Tax=Candidatus Komeilibacteria bacterium CG11_big_fil_rev_8_21_14_0_20_36_20 TaxID=1974477 RepID=A0A2H0NEP8_9BACT|nr:MAG: hypothetical protein COV55_00070 [Candidatus Komeilibacteria bacterium CG11_big_fil_rev_8_21_14_0_20_36_20]PIR81185.1 MAG: hypothetical protein COU21_04940 [Candidatus Komeilibacteria bacterium CG10_big_fil_rev_8_21_14_0_10_36_65]PJC55755.1 MAG: hypothetical protein CO027_00335 [Candidatus Komeilibacteria bacterium CG_4_9_14_0_2_um_filter_36_13]
MKYGGHRKASVSQSSRGLKGKIFNSNLFIIALLLLLIFSFVKVTKGVLLRYKINQEISHLEEQLGDLQSKTENMQKLITYLETDEYIEKEARLKLNLSKPGEKQINLSNIQEGEDGAEEKDYSSNITKWFKYFFESH